MNDQYAKIFASMYSGSMYGAGMHIFATWGWALTHKDENGEVEINPELVAHQLGGTIEQVQQAIDYLTRPDPNSRSKSEDGRRLVKISQFGYRVVNHEKYRTRGGDRREYWRKWRREHKADTQTDGEQDDPGDGATVAQRCAQRCATHTKPKAKTEIYKNPKSLGLGAEQQILRTNARAVWSSDFDEEDHHRKIIDGAFRLSHALTVAFPQPDKYQTNTLRRIVRHFSTASQYHPEYLIWFDQAISWLREAQEDGDSPYMLFLDKVKKGTTYRPK